MLEIRGEEPGYEANIRRMWTCQIESESSLPRATDNAEEWSKNGLRSDLRTSNLKNFPRRTPPLAAACLRTQSRSTHAVKYSAGPIQFCFRRACNNQLLALIYMQVEPFTALQETLDSGKPITVTRTQALYPTLRYCEVEMVVMEEMARMGAEVIQVFKGQ